MDSFIECQMLKAISQIELLIRIVRAPPYTARMTPIYGHHLRNETNLTALCVQKMRLLSQEKVKTAFTSRKAFVNFAKK